MREWNLKVVAVLAVLGVALAVLIASLTKPGSPSSPGRGLSESRTGGVATVTRRKKLERQEKFAKNIRKLTSGSVESQDLLQHLQKELRSGDEDRIADALSQTLSLDDAELVALASEGLRVLRQPEFRQDLVVALRSVAGRESLMVLNEALRDADPSVRANAITSLAVVNREMENLYEAAEKRAEAGQAVSDETALPQMPSEDDLAKLGDGLLAVANDESEDVRKELNNVLSMMAGELQMVGYQAASQSQYPEVRKDGLADLTGNMSKDKVGLLLSYLDDRDEGVRGEAETFCDALKRARERLKPSVRRHSDKK